LTLKNKNIKKNLQVKGCLTLMTTARLRTLDLMPQIRRLNTSTWIMQILGLLSNPKGTARTKGLQRPRHINLRALPFGSPNPSNYRAPTNPEGFGLTIALFRNH
jgi:hypothetical protein